MWYFIEDNQKRGSFSLEEMESLANQGDINENTLVWKKGMKEWQPLSQTELTIFYQRMHLHPFHANYLPRFRLLIEMFKKKELKQQVLIPQHLPLKRMLE
ncbi:DUF4339 domain-containing protein [Microcystis aeruginosa]|jgi:hypothetical protein|uniref:DUF4339 domain-containing protein n=1 Tax=Microcystis aeruginosa TaxID=1126 RepID=UPI001D1578EC|nr:DUF4339 domain-containing protein [Microcystis aeruginosa]